MSVPVQALMIRRCYYVRLNHVVKVSHLIRIASSWAGICSSLSVSRPIVESKLSRSSSDATRVTSIGLDSHVNMVNSVNYPKLYDYYPGERPQPLG